MLSPGGIFIFSTIFIDSTFARFLGRHWPWILPMHVSYFDKKLLSAILSESGYRILYTGNYVHYARLTYVLEMLIKRLPKNSRSFLSPILKFLPSSLVFPFAFGDVRTFVCEKSRADWKSCQFTDTFVDYNAPVVNFFFEYFFGAAACAKNTNQRPRSCSYHAR